jgi:hypothetical protein
MLIKWYQTSILRAYARACVLHVYSLKQLMHCSLKGITMHYSHKGKGIAPNYNIIFVRLNSQDQGNKKLFHMNAEYMLKLLQKICTQMAIVWMM